MNYSTIRDPNIAEEHLALCKILKTEDPMLPSEWCDAHRVISTSSSSEPGRWRTSRTPYIKEPFDHLHPHSPVTRVTLMKGHQVAYTQGILVNAIAYTIGHHPRTVLLVTPSQKHTQKIFYQKIDPMIHDSPSVKGKISARSKFAMRNTVLHKDFQGGFVSGVGANVASDLAGASVQVLLLDEVDRMTGDVEGEGSPVELSVARTAIYRRKKIFMGSTPVLEETSVVHRWFLEGDQRYYFVPCPHCGYKQTLVIERLKFDDGVPIYKCEKCGEHIKEKHKTMMLESGEWRATTEPIDPSYRSYHLNSLYSPIGFLSWSDVLLAKRRADDDQYFAKSFRNLYLGLPNKDSIGEIPVPRVIQRMAESAPESPTLSRQSMLITGGVDIQKDRIEMLVCGFKERKMHVLDHHILWGETLESDIIWEDLRNLLNDSEADYLAIDCGYIPHRVFSWQKRYQDRRVRIVKGTSSVDRIISLPKFMEVSTFHKRQKRGNKFYEVATDTMKDEIYSRLILDDYSHEEFISFPKGLSSEFYSQLCSERKVLKTPDSLMDRSRKANPYKWIAVRHRNEVLDMMVYALAMFYFSGAAKHLGKGWASFVERRKNQTRRAS